MTVHANNDPGREPQVAETAGNPVRRLGAVALQLLLGAALAWSAAFVGVLALAAAGLTSQPALLAAAALLGGVTGLLIGQVGTQRSASRSRRRLVQATALVVTSVLATLTLVPGATGHRAGPVAGQRSWILPNGDRLRYVEVRPPNPRAGTPPVVFLHGGPGVADLAGDSAYFGRLVADGFHVYVYDQVGAGGSTRLSEPRTYSLRRDVANLEAVRQRIGAPRLILVGHSYGALVAAGYLAAHPGRVARLVLSSPASLDPADSSGGNLTSRLTDRQRLALYVHLLRSRSLFIYALLQVNPTAAHRLATDQEMDGRSDAVYAAVEPALHCAGAGERRPLSGTSFYRLQYPQSRTAPPTPDLRPLLAAARTPALIIKGQCDYLSWSSADTYLRALPNARLVYLNNAGHNAYQDAPERYLDVLSDFLRDKRSAARQPVPATAPPGYQGPP